MPPLHNSLYKELQSHNDFFDQLVDMFAAQVYVAGQSGDSAYNTKYFKGQHKESKESRRARNKASKKAKLDPATAETTHQMKERLEQEQHEMALNSDHDDEEDEVKPKGVRHVKQKKGSMSKSTAPPPPTTTTTTAATESPNNASRIEALREKLHAKLAEQRGQRPLDPTTISKRASRRAEKLKRKEEAILRSKTAGTKVKDAKKAFVLSSPNATTTPKEDLQTMDFGKLAGLNPTPESFQNNKSLKNLNKKKNLELMLQKAEEKRDRILQLKQGTDEEKKKAANMQWGEALKEASGDRVKDDPAKLKKALKRKVAQKEKSQKAWKSRMEQTKEKMDERQTIRNHNLKKRKEGGSTGANLSSKKIKDDAKDGEEKKSRKMSRAGFEGKKQEFLNNKKKNGSTTPSTTQW